MRKLLLLTFAFLMSANVATADVFGVYSDATASSCHLAAGFTSSATVVQRFSLGATGSRFKVVLPAGSSFFAFNTPFVPIGNLTNDLSLGYGQCLSGAFSLGTIVANLVPGQIHVQAADAFPYIIYTDCVFAELPAYGQTTCVVVQCDCGFAVQPSTWGKVKSLYR